MTKIIQFTVLVLAALALLFSWQAKGIMDDFASRGDVLGSTLTEFTANDTGAEVLSLLNSSFDTLNTDKLEHSDLSGGTGITYTDGAISFDCSEVEGTGINCATEAITLDATGDWTGTLDGVDGATFVTHGELYASTSLPNLNITESQISDLGTYLTASSTNLTLSGYLSPGSIIGYYGSDCSAGNYAYGINADGSLDCRADANDGSLSYLSQIGDVSTTSLANGDILTYRDGWMSTSSISITTDSRIGVGTQDPASLLTYAGFLMAKNDGLKSDFGNLVSSSSDWPSFFLVRSRGTNDSPLIVADDDKIGFINFNGYDGTDFETTGASIETYVDGTPGANSIPAEMRFIASGTARMVIRSDGKVGIGTLNPSQGLDVSGNANISGNLTVAFASSTGITATNFWGTLVGNASTATALAANGANCDAGNAPLGIDASGAVESCFDVWTEAENAAAAYVDQTYASSTYALASDWTSINNYPSACSAGQYVSAIGDTLTCSAPTETPWTEDIDGGGFDLSNVSTITASSVGAVLYADQYPGADIGAKINAAYADLPEQGGTIKVPTGAYSFSTPIVMETEDKFATIECDAGTKLAYTGSGSAITIDTLGLDNSEYGIDGCTLRGPDRTGSTVGVYLGGTYGAAGAKIQNTVISDFGTGLTWGDHTYMFTISHSQLQNNGTNLLAAVSTNDSGENIQITDSTISNWEGYDPRDCVYIETDNFLSIHFENTSFDNCQLNNAATSAVVQIGITNSHFENPAADANGYYYQFIKNGATDVDTAKNIVSISNTIFIQQGATDGLPPAWIVNNGDMYLSNVSATVGGGISDNFATGTGSMISSGFSWNLFWDGDSNEPCITYFYNWSPLSSNSMFDYSAEPVYYLEDSTGNFFYLNQLAVGTSSIPSSDVGLEVVRTVSGASDYYQLNLEDSSNAGMTIGYDTTNSRGVIYPRVAEVEGKDLLIGNPWWTTSSIFLSSGGDVGIGTVEPDYKLDVSGTINASGAITGSNLSGTNTGDTPLEKCFTIATTSMAVYEDAIIWSPEAAITVSKERCRVVGGTSVAMNISDGTNDMDSITCATTLTEDASLSNNSWSADEQMTVEFGTVTGNVDTVNYCIVYSYD